jgi:hypothetical protein
MRNGLLSSLGKSFHNGPHGGGDLQISMQVVAQSAK